MKKIFKTVLFGIFIPSILFSFSEEDMMYSYKNMKCTQTSKENREVIINAIKDRYVNIEKSISIISGTVHQLSFRNEKGKETIVYVMSTYDACTAFDSSVKVQILNQ